MTTLYDYCYYDYRGFDCSLEGVGPDPRTQGDAQDASSPVVLVYQPQSHATPDRAAAGRQKKSGRQQRRQRAGCLTEILWDDVQKARDLLRMSRRRRRQEHQLGQQGESATGGKDGFQAVTATPALRSLKHHCRTGSSYCQTPMHKVDDLASSGLTASSNSNSAAAAAAITSLKASSGSTRIRELSRQILRGFVAPADCGAPHRMESPKTPASRDSVTGRLCIQTQYPLELTSLEGNRRDGETTAEEDNRDAELRRLQDEAAVQAALVEANSRLLRECQQQLLQRRAEGGLQLAGRQSRRRRTLDFARSQEKLRALNTRIAQIRTRDLQMSEQQQQQQQPQAVVQTVVSADVDSIADSVALSESRPSFAGSSDLFRHHHSFLKKSASLTSSSSATSTSSSSKQPAAISHAGSLDSGFQEIVPTPAFAAFDQLLACDFQLIDQDDAIDE